MSHGPLGVDRLGDGERSDEGDRQQDRQQRHPEARQLRTPVARRVSLSCSSESPGRGRMGMFEAPVDPTGRRASRTVTQGRATQIPTRITRPTSTPSVAAMIRGPGVGGNEHVCGRAPRPRSPGSGAHSAPGKRMLMARARGTSKIEDRVEEDRHGEHVPTGHQRQRRPLLPEPAHEPPDDPVRGPRSPSDTSR